MAGNHLSGPFEELEKDDPELAILESSSFATTFFFTDSLPTAPRMAQLAERHPRINLLNLKVVSVGQLL
jgi:hypothetical protein